MASPSAPVHPARNLAVFLAMLIGVYLLVFLTGDKLAEPKLGIDLQGGTRVTLTARTPDGSAPTRDALNQAQQIISARVNGLGVSGSEVIIDGNNLVITVPGSDGNEARNLGQTARLYVRPVAEALPVQALLQAGNRMPGQPGGAPGIPGLPPGAGGGLPGGIPGVSPAVPPASTDPLPVSPVAARPVHPSPRRCRPSHGPTRRIPLRDPAPPRRARNRRARPTRRRPPPRRRRRLRHRANRNRRPSPAPSPRRRPCREYPASPGRSTPTSAWRPGSPRRSSCGRVKTG